MRIGYILNLATDSCKRVMACGLCFTLDA